MTEHLCVVCAVRNRRPVHYERAQVCQPCRIWLVETLAGIPGDFAELHDRYQAHADLPWTVRQLVGGRWAEAPGRDPISAALPSGAPGRTPPRFGLVTGTRDREAPIDLDLVDLTASAREHQPSDEARRERMHQIGHISIAYRLDQWVRDWRTYTWCGSDIQPAPTVPDLATWLGRWVDAACDQHPAIDDFADEIREVHGSMRAYIPRVVERNEPPPRRRAEPYTAPCRGCDMVSLWWFPSDERVRCDTEGCGVVMTEDEYAQWARQIIAFERGAGRDRVG